MSALLYSHLLTDSVYEHNHERVLIHLTRKKQIQYSSKWIKTVKCKLRIWRKPAINKYIKQHKCI